MEEILIISTTVILPLLMLLMGYFLGKNRDNEKTVYEKKLLIYSDIVYHLNSSKYLRLNLDVSLKNLESLTNANQNENIKVDESSESKHHSFAEVFEDVNSKVSLLNFKDELIKLFAPARLIGSKAVVDELREYFSLITEYFDIKEKKDLDLLNKKISKSVMELEQLMRKDLGRFRIFSKADISWHTQKDK